MSSAIRDEQNLVGISEKCLLFWERESVFLAGSERLLETRRLELPEENTTPDGIRKTRCPTTVVEAAWLAKTGLKYSKQINGPQLFGDLASQYTRWPILMECLPCLEVIVRTLVEL